jgi:NADPH-dependent 2,4-dienoyl-CoA reductase/sulfur reductase-like enzyme
MPVRRLPAPKDSDNLTDGIRVRQTKSLSPQVCPVAYSAGRGCELVCTSDEALHWKSCRKIIIVGGVIGCEFACMMHEYGVESRL